jgi:glycosyltransferase involved in cell wall biosynthesis
VTRRLLQAMAGAAQGGAEIFFVRLAAALQRAGETQRVLIRRQAARSRQLREAGVEVAEAAFGGAFDLATRRAFQREIAEWRPTHVLTWMSRATQLCPPGDFVHVARLGGYYDLKYYRRCDHLVANTRAIAAYALAHGWRQERVHYLPNFVPDLRGAAPVDRASFGTPEDAPLALALGRLHSNKGFDLLLEALAATRDVYLWLAGDGPLRVALERQAADLGVAGRVRFLGWRGDAAALLASADFLVSPSRHEPLGNVVIEAWSAGVAVVATTSDGPAALIETEETGLLVPIAAAPLAEAIERLARDSLLRTRLAAAGRRAFEAQFTEAAVVAAYRSFLDKVAA